jgi:hypothetical protein
VFETTGDISSEYLWKRADILELCTSSIQRCWFSVHIVPPAQTKMTAVDRRLAVAATLQTARTTLVPMAFCNAVTWVTAIFGRSVAPQSGCIRVNRNKAGKSTTDFSSSSIRRMDTSRSAVNSRILVSEPMLSGLVDFSVAVSS